MISTLIQARYALIDGRLVSPGWVAVEGRVVVGVGSGAPPRKPTHVFNESKLVPGLVDIHCHGGGGHSFADGVTSATAAAAFHARRGTTSVIASLVSAPPDALHTQLTELAELVGHGVLAGVHLEGPYLAETRCGAHDPKALSDPSLFDLRRLIAACDGAPLMVTLAPERANGLAAIELLCAHAATVGLGHSDATYGQAKEAVDAGVSVATHLMNGMRPLHHREPGPILALLESPRVTCELIVDGFHLHDGIVRRAFHVLPRGRIALVSDCISAAGMPDGHYMLGTVPITVGAGIARTTTGGLAGSTSTLLSALQRALAIVDCPAEVVLEAATSTPADALKLSGRGRLSPGCRADLLVLSRDNELEEVMMSGAWLADICA